MAMNFLLKRSGTADKRPDPTSMALGELDLNYDAVSGGVFYKDSNGDVVKVGSAQVSADAPNATPAGSAGNSTGEFWYDTVNSALKMWDGAAWIETGGGGDALPTTGGTMTGSITFQDAGEGVIFNGGSSIFAISDAVNVTSSTTAASSTAVSTLRTSAILKSVITTTGDMIYASAAQTPARLPIGASGNILVVKGGAPSWDVFPLTGTTGASNTNYGRTTVNTGTSNTSVGVSAGAVFGASSARNTALGASALALNVSGANNTAVGMQALAAVTSGNNIGIGYQAGNAITTGTGNTIIGSTAGSATLTNNLILATGNGIKLQVNENGAVGVGSTPAYGDSGQVLTSAGTGAAPTWSDITSLTGITDTATTALGVNALNSLTDPSVQNTAVGIDAGAAVTDGDRNTLIGYQAGQSIVSSSQNTFIGWQSGVNSNGGSSNVSVGQNTGPIAGGANSVFVGVGAGNIAEGFSNVGVGAGSLGKVTGNFNTGVGHQAGLGVTSGSSNTFVGRGAGSGVTTGSNNTIIGRYPGSTALQNNFVVSCDTDIKLQINENDALSVGTLNSFGTEGQVLKSYGSAAPAAWASASYGAFSDAGNQTNLDTTNGNAVTLDTTSSADGFSVVSNTQVTASIAGVYNIQISLQVEKTDSGSDEVEIWFKKNGVDIANSNTALDLVGNGAAQLFSLNLVEPLAAGDYVEVWWWSTDVNVQLSGGAAAGPGPAIPSAIVTVVPVGA